MYRQTNRSLRRKYGECNSGMKIGYRYKIILDLSTHNLDNEKTPKTLEIIGNKSYCIGDTSCEN